jgi:hypothetical protein
MKARTKLIAALSFSTLASAGCYIVPTAVGPDGQPIYTAYPIPPVHQVQPGPAPAMQPTPVSMPARLYPANDLANQTGMITGMVTNMRTGKGRFQIQYGNEVMTGEATRHGNDERSGIASAYGSGGSFMQCEYQMNSPVQGAGQCTFSNGARYRLHIGS